MAAADIVASDETTLPAIASQFALEITGMTTTEIKTISGLSFDVNDIPTVTSGESGREIQRFNPGTTVFSPISFTRDFAGDKEFFDWMKAIIDGQTVERKSGSVVLFDFSGTESQRWNFEEAWPSSWSLSGLEVGADAVMTESITLQIETLERMS